MKRALICGVSWQDGAYLAKLLLGKGYQVWGTSRDAQVASLDNLKALGIFGSVTLLSMAQADFRSVLNSLILSDPDEVYFLSGQSSVGLSFDQPAETMESVSLGALNMLEAVRFVGKPIKAYHASSSECFGDVGSEQTGRLPEPPFAVQIEDTIHRSESRVSYGFQRFTPSFNRTLLMQPLLSIVTVAKAWASIKVSRGRYCVSEEASPPMLRSEESYTRRRCHYEHRRE